MAQRSSSPVLLLWLPKPSTWMGLTNWTRCQGRTNRKSAWSGTNEWKLNSWKPACTMPTSSKDTPSITRLEMLLSVIFCRSGKTWLINWLRVTMRRRPQLADHASKPTTTHLWIEWTTDWWEVRAKITSVRCAMHDTSTTNDKTQVCCTETTPSNSEKRPCNVKSVARTSAAISTTASRYITRVTFVWRVDYEAEDTIAQRLTFIIVYRSHFSFPCF